MRDFLATAEQLRTVKQAHRDFIRLWTLENGIPAPTGQRLGPDVGEREGADDKAFDWMTLYPAGVMDD